jgi:hypothetical protein
MYVCELRDNSYNKDTQHRKMYPNNTREKENESQFISGGVFVWRGREGEGGFI